MIMTRQQREAYFGILGGIGIVVFVSGVSIRWLYGFLVLFPLACWSISLLGLFLKAHDPLVEAHRRFFRGGFALGCVVSMVVSCFIQILFRFY